MATENIIINFEVQTDDLKQAADELVKMGQITQKEADAFKRVNLEAKEIKKTVKELNDVANKAAADTLNNQAKATEATKKTVDQYKSLRQQMAEARAEVDKIATSTGGKLTPELLKATKRAAELKDKISDMGATLDALNPEAKLTAFVQVGAGISGAFTAAQGAMALFGKQSEDVQAALLKVQAALALTQGLNSVLQLGDAFKNLKTLMAAGVLSIQAMTAANAELAVAEGASAAGARALALSLTATGIGAIVVAVGLLAAGMYKLSEANDEAAASSERLAKKQQDALANQKLFAEKFSSELDKIIRQRERELALLEATDGKEKEVFAAKLALIQSEIDARNKAIAAGQYSKEDEAKEIETIKDLTNEKKIIQIEYTKFLRAQFRDRSKLEQAEGTIDPIAELMKWEDYQREKTAVLEDELQKRLILDEDFAKLQKEIFLKEDEKYAKERAAQRADEDVAAQQVAIAGLEFINQLNQQAAESELAILDQKQKQGEISQEEYARKSLEIRRKAAQQDKNTAIFEAIINTAASVTKVLDRPPLAALVAALGAIQIAAIQAQPLPKYKKGTLSLQGGGGGIDDIHIMANRGEAIIPTETNRKYSDTIEAIYKGTISPSEINNFVKDRSKASQGYSPYDFKYAMNGLNMNVGNADYLANKIGDKIMMSTTELKVLAKRAV